MNIDIQSLHFMLQPELNNFILDKVNKLQHFQSGILSAHVILKVEKSDTQDNKTCEIKLDIPGNDLFAKKQSKTFEEATAMAVDALQHQIDKRKTSFDTKIEKDLL